MRLLAAALLIAVAWPVPGPVVREFQPPVHPYGPGHRGVDIAAERGEVVVAALPGVVHFSGVVARAGWVSIDHGAGLRTTYGVLDPRYVRDGQVVRAGDALGRLTAGHLDWGALLHGDYIDPLTLFGRWEPYLLPDE
jgi:murein DD-endopeptidase MepM/ murein hydrolase activator NlpD